MPKYLIIQEAPVTDSITADGHVGARKPWPVVADMDGTVVTPSSLLGMAVVVGFQRDLAGRRPDLYWDDMVADPQQVVGMYMVSADTDENWRISESAVDSVTVLETEHEIPVERA